MEASYFYFFVLPLGIFVGILALLVFYYARKEELAERKLKKLMGKYVRKRLKQKEAFNKELERLEELFQNKSIDQITYERLKQLLENNYEKKREDALTQFTSLSSKNDPSTQH